MFVIAGATGHVGGVAARELLNKKKPVTVIVRDAAKGEAWKKLGAQIAVGVLDDGAFLNAALKGAEGLFVLLPPNFAVPDLFAFQKKTADTIAAAVKADKVPHVVLLSSVGADLSSGNGPIRGLNYFEGALKSAGTTLTAIRACYFQENIENSLAPARKMGIFPNFFPSADASVPMIATKDIGMLAAQSLMSPPAKSEAVDLLGPSYSVRQMAEILGKALGKTLKIVDVPAKDHIATLVQAGFPEHIAKVFAEMYDGFAKGRIAPKGDRMAQGKTTLPEVVAALTAGK